MSETVQRILFNEQEASQYTGMSRQWFRQGRSTGTIPGKRAVIPYVRLGRAIRYTKAALDQFIADNTVNP